MAAWLQKHPQPPAPDKKDHPKEGPGCESLSNPTQFISYVPTSVKMALVATESAPWAFVRFDIDENGNTYNLRPVRNSGFREFADASLITVSFWKYSGQPKALGLKDCTGLVQVTK